MLSIDGFFLSVQAAKEFEHLGRIMDAVVRVGEGGIRGAIYAYQSVPSPDVLIIEVNETKERAVAAMSELANYCNERTNVIVMCARDDVRLYNGLMRLGITDFIVGIPAADTLRQKIQQIYSPARPKSQLSQGIAFMGVHGGAGNSTMAQIFAFYAARQLKMRTILIDFDLAFGTLAQNFGLKQSPPGLMEALMLGDNLRSATLSSLLTSLDENLLALCSPNDLNQAYDIPEDLISHLVDIVYPEARLCVFDLPNQWTGWVHQVLLHVRSIVLTVERSRAQIERAGEMIDFLRRKLGDDITIRVIVNKVTPKRGRELDDTTISQMIHEIPRVTLKQVDHEYAENGGTTHLIHHLCDQSNFNRAMEQLSSSLFDKVRNPNTSGLSRDASPSSREYQPSLRASAKEKILGLFFNAHENR